MLRNQVEEVGVILSILLYKNDWFPLNNLFLVFSSLKYCTTSFNKSVYHYSSTSYKQRYWVDYFKLLYHLIIFKQVAPMNMGDRSVIVLVKS